MRKTCLRKKASREDPSQQRRPTPALSRLRTKRALNRGLFQRLSGFETGHPAAAGSLPAFDFSVSDEQGRCFSRLRYALF